MNLSAIRENAKTLVAEFDVRTSSIDTPVGTLSGGNQQKVILAREVGRKLRLLLASQPTRGLDVGSIEFVHRRIVEERDQGAAVIIISSELDEIYALADRIAVMYEGKFTGFRAPTVPVAELGLLMAGVVSESEDGAAGLDAAVPVPVQVTEAGNPAFGVDPTVTVDPAANVDSPGDGGFPGDGGPADGAAAGGQDGRAEPT
jgi:simple sugar transport system ATP-binding protein